MDLPDCHPCDLSLEEKASHAFYHCPRMDPFWEYDGQLKDRITPEKLMLIDLAYVCDTVSSRYCEMKRVVILALIAVARMVIWTKRMKEM